VSASSPLRKDARFTALICVGLAALVGAVFAQTAEFEWAGYDDGDYVYRSGLVTSGISAGNVVSAFTRFHAHNWHPLTTLSHMLDCQLFGVNPHAHHVTNVALHGLATIGLFLALNSLSGAIWRSGFVAAVFAIHPLHVESVAWIAERKDVLSGLCFATLLLLYGRYVRAPSALKYLAALFVALLGLLSKPTLVTIPFVLLLIDYWPLHRFGNAKTSRVILDKIPFALLALGVSIATLLAQQEVVGTGHAPIALRLENAVVSYGTYLRQLFWPVNLAVLYPHPAVISFGVVISCALLLVAISVAAVALCKRWPFVPVGWFWFVGMLVPMIGMVQVGQQAHADRYTYLPLIGLVIAVTWSAAEIVREWRWRGPISAALAGASIIALSACAHEQTRFWRNGHLLWAHALAVTHDNDAAHVAFATALFAEGKADEAVAQMRIAAQLRPSNTGAFGEAPIAQDEQQVDDGILWWSEKVEEQANDVAAHNNLGVLLAQKHHARAALAQWEKSLELSPEDGNAQSNIAWLLATAPDASLRDGSRAVALAEHVLELAGGVNPLLQRTVAAAYAEAGRFDNAVEAAQRGRELAEREGNQTLARELAGHVSRYKHRLPLRDSTLQE